MGRNRKYGSTKILDKKKDFVIRDLKRVAKEEITIEEVAQKYGVSRASLFNWMKKHGISITKFREQIKKELEEQLARKIKRRDIKVAPPKDFIEFVNLNIVKQAVINMSNAGLSRKQLTKVMVMWYKLSKGFIGRISGVSNALNQLLAGQEITANVRDEITETVYESVHPAALTQEHISAYLAKLKTLGYEINNVISTIQAIEKWTGMRLRPFGLDQQEYKGKFREAEIPVEARYLFLRYAKEMFPEKYEMIRAAAMLLFRGPRREGLQTAEYVETVTLKPMPEFLMETKFVVIKTKEKGKKGRKFEWSRPIPMSEAKYIINHIPFSPGEVKQLETIFKKILYRIYEERPDLFNQDTKRYLGLDGNAKAKVFHLWRHTAARSALRTFHWNRYLVARLLGWEKSDNLQIYGDFTAIQLLQEMPEERPPYMFLYGEWLQKARQEGLL